MTEIKKEKMKLSREMTLVSRQVGKVMGDYAMIQDGDRILVGISGGKSSLLLWQMLRYFQRVAPVDFEILPVYVAAGQPDPLVGKLKEYFEQDGAGLHVESADNSPKDFFLGQDSIGLDKGFLKLAESLGINKIALGHTLDDLAENILLNLCRHAKLAALRPKEDLPGRRFTIIRPLAYIKAEEVEVLFQKGKVLDFGKNKHRAPADPARIFIRSYLKDMEKSNPFVKKNILGALSNIKESYLV